MAKNEHYLNLRGKIYNVIFGYESKAGKLFDLFLICMIVVSVVAVLFDSVQSYHLKYGGMLTSMEWFFTIAFTIEYALRLYSTPNTRGYIFSFYGIIDLVSILPTYIAFLFPSAAYLIVIRIMRVLRIFRILKLFRYMGEANLLYSALVQARRKIMFIIEGPENGFRSIPESIYWAIVTITTVGYGDISPQTPLGQTIAAIAMICGYAFIAVPTGIIGAELMQEVQRRNNSETSEERKCINCEATGHDLDARFCKICGNLITQS
jgi:voltage-gated potassium channel